ncbi:MAG: hypothetical protein WCX17_01040 [Parcubacteria group bacterium]|jgi:hypothetical protein
MLPKDYLLEVKGKNQVTLEARSTALIALIAITPNVRSSVPADRTGNGFVYVPSISFFVEEGKRGLIALRANPDKGSSIDMIVSIENDWAETSVDIGHHWKPSLDRIGQAANSGIVVNIDGIFYTSDIYYTKKDKRIVNNANLLLTYLNKEVPAQAIIDVACDEVRESDALTEAAELRKKVEKSEKRIQKLNKSQEELWSELLKRGELVSTTEKGLKEALEKIEKLRASRLKFDEIINGLLDPHKNKPWWTKRLGEIGDIREKEFLI